MIRCGEITIFCACGKKTAVPEIPAGAGESRTMCTECGVQIVHARPAKTPKRLPYSVPTSTFLFDDVIPKASPVGGTFIAPVKPPERGLALERCGFVLAPVEPTEEMYDSAWHEPNPEYGSLHMPPKNYRAIYQAMLRARPLSTLHGFGSSKTDDVK